MTKPLERRLERLERDDGEGTMILGDNWPIVEDRGKEVPANYIRDLLRAVDGKTRGIDGIRGAQKTAS